MAEDGVGDDVVNDLIKWASEHLSLHFGVRNPSLSVMDKSTILATVSARRLGDALDDSGKKDAAGEPPLCHAFCDLFNERMKERSS